MAIGSSYKSVTIYPEEGSFVFIYDFKEFSIPKEVALTPTIKSEGIKNGATVNNRNNQT